MKQFGTVAAALMLLLVLGFIPQNASAQPARWAGPGFAAGDPLNLTPEQEKKIEELWMARMEMMTVFADRMMKLRLEMNEIMRDPRADQKKIDDLIERMSALRAEHQKEAFRHRERIESILTPEQVERLQTYRAYRGRFPGQGMMPGLGGFGMGMMPGMRGMSRGWCLLGMGAWDDYYGRGYIGRPYGRDWRTGGKRPGRGMWRLW